MPEQTPDALLADAVAALLKSSDERTIRRYLAHVWLAGLNAGHADRRRWQQEIASLRQQVAEYEALHAAPTILPPPLGAPTDGGTE